MRLKLSKITFLSNTLIKDVFFRFNETAVHTDGKGFGIVVDKKKDAQEQLLMEILEEALTSCQ